MDIHHGHRVEHVVADDVAIGDDDPECGPDVEHVVEVVADGQAEAFGRSLDRRRHQVFAAAASAVGIRYHEGDVVAGLDERFERPDCDLGSTEVDEPCRPAVMDRHGVRFVGATEAGVRRRRP